uniref:Leucine-rich repeat-containing protein 59 n=1 Tax=Anopheles farauti TaxID=69004 RepID=A0A182QYZ2_9DIPT
MATKQQDQNEENINVRDRLTDNVLDLSLMNISKVPVQAIKPLRRATTLDLSNNRISIIESNFTDLTQLTQLDLSKNRITFICDDFGLLTNLRRLDLYKNQLTRLPLTFGRLRNLKYLDLQENPLNPTFKKLIGTCSDTSDCLAAASRAVEFMKQVERRVLEDRTKERKVREAKEQRQQEEKLKLEVQRQIASEAECRSTVDNEPEKTEKTRRRRKPVTQGNTDTNAKEKTAAKAGHKPIGDGVSSGLRHSSMLWLLVLLLLIATYVLYTKHSDVLQMTRDGSIRESRDAILEEYIK